MISKIVEYIIREIIEYVIILEFGIVEVGNWNLFEIFLIFSYFY